MIQCRGARSRSPDPTNDDPAIIDVDYPSVRSVPAAVYGEVRPSMQTHSY